MLERGERFEGRGRRVFACGGATSRRATLRAAQGPWRGSSDRHGSTAGACPECGETEWVCGALPRFSLWRPASARPTRTVRRTAIRAADGCRWPQGHRAAKRERRAAILVGGARVCPQPASSHPWHAAALSSHDFTQGRAADSISSGDQTFAAARVASSWACRTLTRASMPTSPRCSTPPGRVAASTSCATRWLMPARAVGASSPLSSPPPLPKTMRRRPGRNGATQRPTQPQAAKARLLVGRGQDRCGRLHDLSDPASQRQQVFARANPARNIENNPMQSSRGQPAFDKAT